MRYALAHSVNTSQGPIEGYRGTYSCPTAEELKPSNRGASSGGSCENVHMAELGIQPLQENKVHHAKTTVTALKFGLADAIHSSEYGLGFSYNGTVAD